MLARLDACRLGLCTALIAFVPFAAAQQMPQTTKKQIEGTPSVKTENFTGTVVQVEGNKLVVRMSNGDIRYFEPPESRTFLIDGREMSFHQLKPGTKLQASVTTTTTPVTERTTTIGTGKVWFVSGNNVILTLPNGENRQYKVHDSYRFIVGGQPASVNDLRKGMTISAQKIVEEPKMVLTSDIAVTGQAPPPPPVARTQVAQIRTPAPEPRATPAPEPVAAPAPTPSPAPTYQPPATTMAQTRPARLPDTASSVPLSGVIGLILIGASFGVRAFGRRW